MAEAAPAFFSRGGVFAQLAPAFGPGAFDEGGGRLAYWLERGYSNEPVQFEAAWRRMQALADDVAGPLALPAATAGAEPARGLQHAITTQLEHAAFQRLQRRVAALPDCKARRAFLEADENSSALVTSSLLMTAGVTLGASFPDCLAHFLGDDLPMLEGRGGERVPCSRVRRRCDQGGVQLETATLPGGHQDDRSNAIRDVIADDLPRARTEPSGLVTHLLPQDLERRVRRGVTPDIGALTDYGQPPARRSEVAQLRTVYFDVKQLTQGAPGYRRRTADRRGPLNVRAAAVPGAYELAVRWLDHHHSRRADGSRYPAPDVQHATGLTGPITTALQSHPEVIGLVVGSFQGASDSVHELQREVARRRATEEWRRMGARSFDDAYGMYLHDVRARWAGVFWASWAALMRNRAVCVGRADAEMLRAGGDRQPGRRGGAYPGVRPRALHFRGGVGVG